MNILAHLYLSGDNEKIIVGNFIGDFVKGKQINKYQDDIAKGIRIHREIDHYTDGHNAVKNVNQFYRSKYGKHSGIVTDIIFDHFLSRNWDTFSDKSLKVFIKNSYKTLNRNIKILPFGVLEFYPFMVLNDWLNLYQSLEGIERVLKGMSKRTSLPGEYKYAISQIERHYSEIDQLFIGFFKELIHHISLKFSIGLKSNI